MNFCPTIRRGASVPLVLAVALVPASVARAVGPRQALELESTTPKPRCLIGEPAVLDVRLRNNANIPVHAREFVPTAHDPKVGIVRWFNRRPRPYISGFTFESEPNELSRPAARPPIRQLKPGGSWCHRLRVLHQGDKPSFLAISDPGTHSFSVRIPLTHAVPEFTVEFTSNLVEIEFQRPEGRDDEVWHDLNQQNLTQARAFGLESLESKRRVEVGKEFVTILRKWPGSGYDDELRRMVLEYAEWPAAPLSAAERAELRRLAREPEPNRKTPFKPPSLLVINHDCGVNIDDGPAEAEIPPQK